MTRYNASGRFNLPVGNVDFNKNVQSALSGYLDFVRKHPVNWFENDYSLFFEQLPTLPKDAYVFCDPPYLISSSEYNKLWNSEKEVQLYSFLDRLNTQGIFFGITNLAIHKKRENSIFTKWAEKYISYDVKSNYISFNDNSIKADSRELFVTNYNADASAPRIAPRKIFFPYQEELPFDTE